VQALSARMIDIHKNRDLYSDVKQTILSHDDIDSVEIYSYETLNKFFEHAEKPETKLNVSASDNQLLHESDILNLSANVNLQYIFLELSANTLLPVKRESELYALIGLQMNNFNSAVNREDLQLLLPLMNQVAIAIENNNYIKESARLVQELTEARTKEKYVRVLEDTNSQLDQKNKELSRLFNELQQKEGQLIHSEKMASLGHLVAGISHELNNPISFIYANTRALEKYIAEITNLWNSLEIRETERVHHQFTELINELEEIIHDNINGSKSGKELVLNLKNFSRLDQADWKESHLIDGIESSLKILKPEIEEGIKILKNYEADPLVHCNPGQLNQVFLNLLSNAIQSLDGKGQISILTRTADQSFFLEITDTGTGIPQDIQKKIFDPFFTTKDVNKGSGLGLSISYTIIQSHGGKLSVQSEPDVGSTFTVCIPLKQKKN